MKAAIQPPNELRNQFIICSDSSNVPDGLIFFTKLKSGKALYKSNTTRILPVFDKTYQNIGWMVGWPVDENNSTVYTNSVLLDCHLELRDSIDSIVEKNIYRIAGSFIFILDADNFSRMYLDACGTLSAVFDRKAHVAGATAGCILDSDEYTNRFDSELYNTLNILGEGWFPAGLTAHFGVERLLINHYLDLTTWETVRHWPVRDLVPTDDPYNSCLRIGAAARNVIDACRAEGPIVLALTGGNETRLLLSLIKDIHADVDFATVVSSKTYRDVVLTRQLVQRFGLNQIDLKVRYADVARANEWHARNGHCVGDVNMRTHLSVEPLKEYCFFLGGLGGEIGRGFFWRKGETATTPISADRIVGSFGMRRHKRVDEAVAEWRRNAPDVDSLTLLDLAYLELRMGCWGFPQCYCSDFSPELHPLISRANFTEMMSLPHDWRAQGRFIPETIRLHWPELLDIPINKFGDFRDYTEKARRAIYNPSLIIKKIRKLVG